MCLHLFAHVLLCMIYPPQVGQVLGGYGIEGVGPDSKFIIAEVTRPTLEGMRVRARVRVGV